MASVAYNIYLASEGFYVLRSGVLLFLGVVTVVVTCGVRHTFPSDKPRECWRGPNVNRNKAKIESSIQAPGLSMHSFLSLAHCHAASTVILLLPKATFTPSIQPNLGLPSTYNYFHHQHPSSHTVPIYSLHVSKPSQYSHSLSILALLRTS